jgi:hypothetical protein
MGLRVWNGMLLAAMAALWMASGTQREKPVLSQGEAVRTDTVRALEASVAQHKGDTKGVRKLAQAYLDARAPGLALSLIESSPDDVRSEPLLHHMYARALIDQGRAVDALAAEREVLDRCADEAACDAWLIASATRRADILHQLVDLGVEDANAHPEASAVAYHNATREARLAIR